ncbi:hypothetical protein AYO38_08890 [bacterium SCGC AG-212-C10]|nr:hypothetical protein AYO38_08890 [bacterium SCGC AG-212-C10]
MSDFESTSPLPVPSRSRAIGGAREDQRLGALRTFRYGRFIRKHWLGVISGSTFGLIILAAMTAPWIAPHEPTEFLSVGPFAGPSPDAWLGTDQIGRDLLSRVLYGARTSLLIAISATTVGILGGATLGLLSGYFGGWIDMLVQRLMDVLDAFPSLILAILFVALMGASSVNVALAVAIVLIPGVNRVARSVVLGLRGLQYIEAANAIGAHPARVMLRHLAPGLVAPLSIVAAAAVGSAIITEASLSFLGLGPPPPTPTWGQMLSGDVRQYFITHPGLALIPGLALTLTVLSISLLGDSLRDALDPRLRRR